MDSQTRALRDMALACIFSLGVGIGTAYAHHSFAAYDLQVTKTATGTLKELDWNAPHAGITVAIADEKGVMQDVPVTTGAPVTIARQGFKPKDFRIGSKVTMSWHPNRNGLLGGELAELKLEDGRVLKGALGPGGTATPEPAAVPAGAAPPAPPSR